MAGGVLVAALALTGCGDDGADPDTTEAEADAAATSTDEEPATTPPTTEDAEVEPFDPSRAMGLRELEVRGEPIFPDGPMPDSLVVPEGVTVATYDSEMGDNEQYHNATGALRVDDPDAEPDEVMAFFADRLPDAGWELAEERDSGMQVWHHPHPEERVWTQQFRVETVKTGDNAVIRWWFTNNG